MNVFSDKDAFLLPDILARTYEVRSCLKYSEQTATYLLYEKASGRPFLLKTAADPACGELLVNEKNLLEFIHQSGDSRISSTFPTPILLEVHEDTIFYIRTYIEGKTLEELCETNYKKPGLPAFRALDYIISLTEILNFFHSLNPPLIHRDIKPQNVVVDAEGVCHFIDLGISRFYHISKKGDTLIMGTRLTAPPEQFGFQQTDMRSDLYSLGILLYYCITGQYEIDDKILAELDPALQQIIRKITMFDPDRRYQSTEELLPVLLRARYPQAISVSGPIKKQRLFTGLLAVLLCINLAASGFLICRLLQAEHSASPAFQTEGAGASIPADSESAARSSISLEEEYIFTEPLIEEAVRIQLNKPDVPITYKDLNQITSLRIFGLQIYSDEADYLFKGDHPWCYDFDMQSSLLYEQKGHISSLEDIVHMPNLTALSLYNQQISDISLLKDTRIEELGLGYNPLTDLSPLAGNESIRYLNVSSLELGDIKLITTLPNLASLNISGTNITSLEGLERCPIETLNLFHLSITDLEVLKKLPSLEDLVFDAFSENMLEQIAGVPIRTLTFYYSNHLSFDKLSSFSNLEQLYFRGNNMQELQIQAPWLPRLKSLELVAVTLRDFTTLSSLEAIDTLFIYSAAFENYTGLDLLPNLETIHCNEEQWIKIQELYPDNSYYFHLADAC